MRCLTTGLIAVSIAAASATAGAQQVSSSSPSPAPSAEPSGQPSAAPRAAVESAAPARPSVDPPHVLHTPVLTSFNDRPLTLAFDFVHPERIGRASVRYFTDRADTELEVVIERASNAYAATIPRQPPQTRWIAYYVRITDADGQARDAFATQEAPQIVVTRPSPDAERELSETTYHRGQHLDLYGNFDYTDWGTRSCSQATNLSCQDHSYLAGGGARYHFYGWVRSIGAEVNVIRGTTDVGATTPVEAGGTTGGRNTGITAATASVELRLHARVSLHLEALLGASTEAVTGGAGGALEIGVDTPTRVLLGLRGAADYGLEAFAWMRWYTIPHVHLGAGVEINDEPGSALWGVRLLGEVGVDLGRYFTLVGRGGFASRSLAAAGYSAGGALQVHF